MLHTALIKFFNQQIKMFRAILKELLISAEVNIHLTFGLGVEMSDLGLVHFFFFCFGAFIAHKRVLHFKWPVALA